LPLTHHDHRYARHRPALIDVLRGGARTGARWFALDTTTGPARFMVGDHRHDFALPTATWVAANVTSPTVGDQWYPALIADGYTTGDGVIARFDLASVSAMAEPAPRPEPGNRPDAGRAAAVAVRRPRRGGVVVPRRRPAGAVGRGRPRVPGPRRPVRARCIPVALVRPLNHRPGPPTRFAPRPGPGHL